MVPTDIEPKIIPEIIHSIKKINILLFLPILTISYLSKNNDIL